jgi:hypothetical protein
MYVMKRTFDYPEETKGSKLAREIRKKCNTLSPKEQMELFQRGMDIINGVRKK